jgi:hypothetical protein
MALLYKFPMAKIFSDWSQAKSSTRVAEIQKAVLKATNDATTTKFVQALKGADTNGFLQDVDKQVMKNLVGKSLMPKNAVTAPSVARQIAIKMVLGPQQAVLLAKADLSVHFKNGKVELQGTDCNGAMKVLAHA